MDIENKKSEINIYDKRNENGENVLEKEVGREAENNKTDWLKQVVNHYKEIFDLSDEELRDKKILEIGACDRRFAIALISEGISNNVFSLEPALGSESKEGYAQKEVLMTLMEEIPNKFCNEVEKRTIIAEAESVPDLNDSYNLVIGKSVPYNSKEQLKERINELLRVSKEVRFYPINSGNRSDYEKVIESIKKIIPITIEYKTTVDCDVEMMESGVARVKEDVLILKKIKENEGDKFKNLNNSYNDQKREHKFTNQMDIPKKNWSPDFMSFVENERENERKMRKLEKKQKELIKILEVADKKNRNDWDEKEKEAYKERKRHLDILDREQKDKKEEIDSYCDDFELTKENIPFMKIMDIGCGWRADFVEDVIKKMDSKNIYGLDTNLEEEFLQKYPHNLYKGSYYEKLPVGNLDLIIARASLAEKDLMQEKFLKNILNSLNEEGELRVYPLFRNHIESDYKKALVIEKELIEKLDEFSKKFNFNYQLKAKEISVYGKDEYPASKNLLIIKKKKKEVE